VWSYFNCSVLFQPPTTAPSPPSSTTVHSPTTTTTTSPIPSGGGTNPSCPTTDPNKLCTKGGYVVDPCNVRVFYQCVEYTGSFTAYRFECSVGTVLVPSISALLLLFLLLLFIIIYSYSMDHIDVELVISHINN
jgi:hypothetical protein